MPEADRRDSLLVRDAMERTVEELPPLHDLVPAAVAQGRRRRARARLAIAAGVVCVAGAVVFGAMMLPGGGDGDTTVRPATSGTPSPHESPDPVRKQEPEPYRTPVHIEPTSDTERAMADLPQAERERRAEFQQKAAVLLDKLLPDTVGLIRPVDLDVRRYQGETEDGKVFTIIFSVRPSDARSGTRPCPDAPGALKGGSCERGTLPGGIEATSYRVFSGTAETMATDVQFSYRDSVVGLTINQDEKAKASAPVTSEELLDAARDSRFLDLVRYADEHPMEERQTSVAGG
ncbi:hypothetical protein ACFOZ0_27385 [Streptomyces yaanensis]|uniref:Uncharacterized protein n=1 Tax=Streptomyces yaanensis TaxID=1142239 RepID=A0ABV7SLV8_9ACTN|nr:hypothetical protein [Streptomyces sp. CGMCC 4.7035]WNB97055.1 hypothetical protein Q2K21_02630 [Streptomyces sp. CGMCC 4.7035]